MKTGYIHSVFYPLYLTQYLEPNIYSENIWGKNKEINIVTSWEECQVPEKAFELEKGLSVEDDEEV